MSESVSVLTTVGQPDIDAHPEWCSVDPATPAAIGREVGHQVRIGSPGGRPGKRLPSARP
jgi:hypothetical protein